MIDFATDRPLSDAVDRLGNKTPIGSMMNSAEWGALPLEIRDRSFFSARVLNEQLLAEMQRRINQGIQQLRDGTDRFMDRGRFVVEMQQILRDMGYQPDPRKKGTLQDISSSVRLSLIWNLNLEMAQNYASWKAQQNEVSLRRAPAQELIRVAERMEKRNWARIWKEAGGKFYGGRMIALRTDDIWRRISEFGVPYPPFRYGSGMGTKNIRRREALTLVSDDGVPLMPDDAAPQVPLQLPFNSGLQGSLKGVPNAGRERLRSEFGDTIQIDGDTISFNRDYTEANEHRENTIREELRARARSAFERGQAALEAGGRERLAEGASGFGFPESAERELLVSAAAVEVGRKRLYHDEYGAELGKPVADLLREVLPPSVRVELIDGHVIAWRPDLVSLSADQLVQISVDGTNGLLLGYGQMSMNDTPHMLVLLRDASGAVVSGFHAPISTARIFAEARRRDWEDATGATGFLIDLIPFTGGAA